MKTPVLAVIPVRWESSRLPGKPLADIGGKTMVQRVWEQTCLAGFDSVVVATDDQRIEEAATAFGARVALTSPDCPSGTDRCAEVAEALSWPDDGPVINVQGDEPFLHPPHLQALAEAFEDPAIYIATLACRLHDTAALHDPNTPKVVVNQAGRALYFSRQAIPYMRDQEPSAWPDHIPYWRHIGVYAYRAKTLKAIHALAPSPLELAESLEQLRWLDHGHAIQVLPVEHQGITVDTPSDLAAAREWAKANDPNKA